jgi:hypothetical protein
MIEPDFAAYKSGPSDFAIWNNELKALCRPRMFYPTFFNGVKNPPYARPRFVGEIKGKMNIKAAKRARVKALKAK